MFNEGSLRKAKYRRKENACSSGRDGGSVVLDINLCSNFDPSFSPWLPGTSHSFSSLQLQY